MTTFERWREELKAKATRIQLSADRDRRARQTLDDAKFLEWARRQEPRSGDNAGEPAESA